MIKVRYILLFIIIYLGLFYQFVHAQQLIKQSLEEDLESIDYDLLKREYGKNKVIPKEFEKPILVALSYFPELQDIKIKFLIKPNKSPLLTRPELFSAFFKQPHKRTYLIIISSDTEEYLKHIEYSKLNFNAQVGVMGHELTHVVDFSQRGSFGLLGISFGNFSSRWIDHFEYETDRKTIDHGLGFQLLAWSNSVRNQIALKYYTGADDITEEDLESLEKTGRERYMKPSTIKSIIREHPLYQSFTGLDY